MQPSSEFPAIAVTSGLQRVQVPLRNIGAGIHCPVVRVIGIVVPGSWEMPKHGLPYVHLPLFLRPATIGVLHIERHVRGILVVYALVAFSNLFCAFARESRQYR